MNFLQERHGYLDRAATLWGENTHFPYRDLVPVRIRTLGRIHSLMYVDSKAMVAPP